LIRHFGAGVDTAWLAWGLTVGACVAVITGTFTRVACVVLALLSAQLAYMAPDGDRGIDKLLRVTLLVLALSKSHACWTVDALVWRRVFKRPIGGASGLIPAWPRYCCSCSCCGSTSSPALPRSSAAGTRSRRAWARSAGCSPTRTWPRSTATRSPRCGR
jgi:hypothetical protein